MTLFPPIRARRGCSPIAILGCGCGLLSGIGILLIFLLLGLQFVRGYHNPTWDKQAFVECQQNLKYLSQAITNYSNDHHKYPDRLEDLSSIYVDNPVRLRCPLEIKEQGVRYHYSPQGNNPADPLITCTNHGQGAIVLQRNGLMRLPTIFSHK